MSLEDSNREILQFKSYEINVNNPVALNRKKSEREKKINPQIVNEEKSKKEIIVAEETNQPINNYPYEFYEETQSIKEIIKNDSPKKEDDKVDISKKEPEKVIEKPKLEEKKTDSKKEEKKEQKVQKKEEPKKEVKNKEESKKEIKKKEVPKKEEKKKEETKKEIKKKEEQKKEEKKKEEPKKEVKKKEEPKKEIKKKEEPKKEELKKEEPKKVEPKKEEPKKEEMKKEVNKEIKNENKSETNKIKEKNSLKDKLINLPKKEEKKPKKVEIKVPKIEEKKNELQKPKIQKENKENHIDNENKKEVLKAKPPQIVEKKKEEQKIEPQKKIEDQIIKPVNEEKVVEGQTMEVHFKELENRNITGQNNPPPLKEMPDKNKVSKSEDIEQLPKTLLTKKTEDNYDLMIKYFKDENYKRGDDVIMEGIINYNDFSSDKFLGLVSEKIKIDNNNRNIIENFLQRNKDETKIRQDNNKTINDRIKLIDESTKKKLYFNNKKSQQDYFDSFYNKQIEFKNNCKEHINKLSNKYDEERKKNYIPEPKKINNLDYFKNNEPVKISKYSFKAKNSGNINNNENTKDKNNEDKNLKSKKNSDKSEVKKVLSFNPNMTDNTYINNNNNNNKPDNSKNEDKNGNKANTNKESKKLKKIKSGPLLTKKEIKLTKKELEEMTNKLHYDGELLKIKKQQTPNEDLMNNSYNNNSVEKLTHSSIIILIKKLLFEYGTSVTKNAYSDYTKNPKLNYEQYIDIFKDLYYLEADALPEDYLEEDSMYKELWDKLIQFSQSPVNSIESNVLLLYLLELNGFFSNQKILKELENELYWIKLEEYDDLIANSKYIEENWDDLKNIKINIIKKLRLEGKYNPIHCEALYNSTSFNSGNILSSNINASSLLNNDINTNHYITTLKGNTNYHFIHGYNSTNKNNENSILRFSNNLSDKNEENKHCSFSISNLSNKNIKNRRPLKDSYKDLIEKKKSQIENMKKDKEEKLKEICTFKPQINTMNKKIFSKEIKIELPKHKKNKSFNLYNNSITQENNKNINTNNINNINNIDINQNVMTGANQTNNINNISNNNINIINDKKTTNKKLLKRNKSSLQKMFKDNPLKEDKLLNDKIEKLKMVKINKDMENYNNFAPPMRFDIEYPSKFESIGININREENMKQRTHNVIFYNIKVNEKIKTLKYIEGDDLKLTVINFVNRNKLPEEVTDIILTKIKEKTNEETF